MKIIGNKDVIAFEIHEYEGNDRNSLEVNLWIQGEKASAFGNTAYLPSYVTKLDKSLNLLETAGYFDFDEEGYSNESEIFEAVDSRIDGGKYEILNYDVAISAASIYLFCIKGDFKLVYQIYGTRTQPRKNLQIRTLDINLEQLVAILYELRSYLPSF